MTKAQYKQVFLKQNVLEKTLERIEYIFDEFQNIIVSVSGGKDSTVLAHLVLKEANKRNRKVGIFFLDEEVVYESTVKQVEYLMNLYPDNTIPIWFQFEFNLTNALSIDQSQLKCWEAGKHKEWMRSKHPKGIHHKPWDKEKETIGDKHKGFGFYDVFENFERTKESTAFLVGIRALESPNRWRAVSRNPSYKDITWSSPANGVNNHKFYPIYDWNYTDIWKYIYESQIKYSKIYDLQFKLGISHQEARVSSLIHEKSFKAIMELQSFEPKTYDKLAKRCRGIQMAELYAKSANLLKVTKLPSAYKNWMQYRDFLIDTYPKKDIIDILKKRFSKHLNNNYVARQQCKQLVLNDYENNFPIDNKPDPREEKLNYFMEIL